MFEDRDGVLWIGTVGGVCRIEGARCVAVDGLKFNARGFHQSADGALWIASNRGLFRYDRDGRTTQWTQRDGLSSDFLTSIAAAPDGTLWISTSGAGLNRFKERPHHELHHGAGPLRRHDLPRAVRRPRMGLDDVQSRPLPRRARRTGSGSRGTRADRALAGLHGSGWPAVARVQRRIVPRRRRRARRAVVAAVGQGRGDCRSRARRSGAAGAGRARRTRGRRRPPGRSRGRRAARHHRWSRRGQSRIPVHRVPVRGADAAAVPLQARWLRFRLGRCRHAAHRVLHARAARPRTSSASRRRTRRACGARRASRRRSN